VNHWRRTVVRKCALLVALVCVASGAAAGEPACEWPVFHGPARDNKSTETGLAKKWPEGGPRLLWTASGLGKGYSSVTVGRGLIYTAGMIGKETYVLAFDLHGKE
jgi:hypothetical protein